MAAISHVVACRDIVEGKYDRDGALPCNIDGGLKCFGHPLGATGAFLEEELSAMTGLARARSWSGFDAEFSRKLGEKGWIGMTWPQKYGGHERSAIERYVVIEELLAASRQIDSG